MPPVSNHQNKSKIRKRQIQIVTDGLERGIAKPRWLKRFPAGQAGASHPSTIRRSVFRGDITKKGRGGRKKRKEKKGKRNHGAAFWPDIFQLPINMIGGERSCKSRARRCPQHAAVINRRQPQPAPTFHAGRIRRARWHVDPWICDLEPPLPSPSCGARSTPPPIETSLANRSGSRPAPSPLPGEEIDSRMRLKRWLIIFFFFSGFSMFDRFFFFERFFKISVEILFQVLRCWSLYREKSMTNYSHLMGRNLFVFDKLRLYKWCIVTYFRRGSRSNAFNALS